MLIFNKINTKSVVYLKYYFLICNLIQNNNWNNRTIMNIILFTPDQQLVSASKMQAAKPISQVTVLYKYYVIEKNRCRPI